MNDIDEQRFSELRTWEKHQERCRLLDLEAKANMNDSVNHPAHYGGAENPYEVIKVLEAWLTRDQMVGFLEGNTIKYMARAKHKNGAEDYAKALWYTNYLNEFEKRNPAPAKIDGAVTRQLQKSMELNAKMKNALRELSDYLVDCKFDNSDSLMESLQDILRMS